MKEQYQLTTWKKKTVRGFEVLAICKYTGKKYTLLFKDESMKVLLNRIPSIKPVTYYNGRAV